MGQSAERSFRSVSPKAPIKHIDPSTKTHKVVPIHSPAENVAFSIFRVELKGGTGKEVEFSTVETGGLGWTSNAAVKGLSGLASVTRNRNAENPSTFIDLEIDKGRSPRPSLGKQSFLESCIVLYLIDRRDF